MVEGEVVAIEVVEALLPLIDGAEENESWGLPIPVVAPVGE